MLRSASDTAAETGVLRPSWLFPVLLLVALQVATVWLDPSLLRDRVLSDADGYTRLLRVEALAGTGDWYDDRAVRANAPYGTTLHWTRPFDVVLLAGAAPLLPFTSLRDALYWSGALVNPLLHVAALVALMWAAVPLMARHHIPYLGVLALALPAVHSYFGIGRADHHGLILLLFIVTLGLGVRVLTAAPKPRLLTLAGVLGALMMWVSVESLVTIAAVMAAFAFSWLLTERPLARDNATYSCALFLGLLFGLVTERPLGALFAVEYDRLSVVHAFVFLLPAVFWITVTLLERRAPAWSGPRRRWLLGFAGVALALAAVAATIPRFFGGPYVDVDPRAVSIWLDNVLEVRSLISPEAPLRSARDVMFLLGHAFVSVPVLMWLARARDAPGRSGWWLVAIAVAMFVPLTLYQARWAPYAEFVLVVPYAVVMGGVLDTVQRRFGGNGRETGHSLLAAYRAFVVAGFACVFLVLGAFLYRLEAGTELNAGRCPLTPMAAYLGEDAALGASSRRVMTFMFNGPEIVYRSPHTVIGTPYHRNKTGILDTYDFFAATNEVRPREIAERRRIDLVLICRNGNEAQMYVADGTTPTMFDRLRGGEAPGWLRSRALPESLAANYSLFEVVR